MKRLTLLAMVLAFVVGMPMFVLASTEENRNAAKLCKAKDNLGYLNFGQCVSIVSTCYAPGNTEPVCICKKSLNQQGAAFFDMYDNLGACISFHRTGINDG